MPSPSRTYALTVHGPFEVPHIQTVKKCWVVDRETSSLARFWREVVGSHEDAADIGGKDGCYVFAMRAARGFQPWYVGKTDGRLDREVFNSRNILTYNDVLMEVTGTPVLFLVTNAEPGRSNLPSAIVDRLESDLIKHAFRKNPRLKNERKLTDGSVYKIDGVGTRGRASEETVKFKKMMGMA
jgi:hypothetical protein